MCHDDEYVHCALYCIVSSANIANIFLYQHIERYLIYHEFIERKLNKLLHHQHQRQLLEHK